MVPRCLLETRRRLIVNIQADRVKDICPQPRSFDIERATKANTSYRPVAWSEHYPQVMLMSDPVGGDVGLEVHPQTDQFLRFDAGAGAGAGRVQKRAANDQLTFEMEVSDGWCPLVPVGTWHNITNIGPQPMKAYVTYVPAYHTPDKHG